MTIDHKAAKEWAEASNQWRLLYPNSVNLAACYLDAMSQLEAEHKAREEAEAGHKRALNLATDYMNAAEAAERSRSEIEALLHGWTHTYGWKGNEYVDDIQDYFDRALLKAAAEQKPVSRQSSQEDAISATAAAPTQEKQP